MDKKIKPSFLVMLFASLLLLLSGCEKRDFWVLDPKGMIAADEKNLIITAILLMLIVVVPVFIMTFVFAWKYRASNRKAKYDPAFSHSTILEVIWWGVPCVIIIILATITWITTHTLDPYKPLDVKTKPITIQVVALDWKWLFLYPEENIATINYIQFPTHVPINFKITADAPMNSFIIPQLGGQIYAMAGMQTKLHLMADHPGDYNGMSVSFSGAGFSDMKFIARASSQEEYNQWLNTVRQSPVQLSLDEYNKIAKPSEKEKVHYYSSVEKDLYHNIIMKFMMPSDMHDMDHSEMHIHN